MTRFWKTWNCMGLYFVLGVVLWLRMLHWETDKIITDYSCCFAVIESCFEENILCKAVHVLSHRWSTYSIQGFTCSQTLSFTRALVMYIPLVPFIHFLIRPWLQLSHENACSVLAMQSYAEVHQPTPNKKQASYWKNSEQDSTVRELVRYGFTSARPGYNKARVKPLLSYEACWIAFTKTSLMCLLQWVIAFYAMQNKSKIKLEWTWLLHTSRQVSIQWVQLNKNNVVAQMQQSQI